ncbi:Crp/Fnr family transcriptional regulator [Falsiroseomonas sp.]|uniref:Crp/Fnr family transcriptional regulator n=1 Tax=Falsiroseomonas sp. TaxID=2870721 RepID=UPI003F704746
MPEFRDLPEAALHRLARGATTLRLAEDASLIRRGDPSDALFVLLQGRLRVSAASVEGRMVTFRLVEPVDLVGEIGVLDSGPRTADVEAVAPCLLVRLPREAVLAALREEPALASAMLRLLCRRLRETSTGLEQLATLRLPARLAAVLLRLAGGYGRPAPGGGVLLPMRLSQSDLSMLAAATREAVNKQLAAWRAEGLVELRAGQMVLRDPAALGAIEG